MNEAVPYLRDALRLAPDDPKIRALIGRGRSQESGREAVAYYDLRLILSFAALVRSSLPAMVIGPAVAAPAG